MKQIVVIVALLLGLASDAWAQTRIAFVAGVESMLVIRRASFVCWLAVTLVANVALAQTKIAFLVGVEKYEKDGFDLLNFAEDDAVALKDTLEDIGFECEQIVGKDATLEKIETGLARFYERSKRLKKEDVVIFFFSGHGIQKLVRRNVDGKTSEREEPFFCPVDAHKNDTSTLLSMNNVLKSIQDNSASSNNIILIDACRESLDKSGKSGMDGSKVVALSNKITLFFAAQSGQRSFESRELNHGVFTYYLIDGLRGAAADHDGEVTLTSLTNYVCKRVERDTPQLLGVIPSEAQLPNVVQNSRGSLVLRKSDKPAELRLGEKRPMTSGLAAKPAGSTDASEPKRFWTGKLPEPIAQKLLDRPVWRTAEAQAEIFQASSGEWYVIAVGKWKLSNRSPREACDVAAHGKLLEVFKGMDAQVVKKLTDDGLQKFVDTSSQGRVPQLPALTEWESDDKVYISVLFGTKIEK